MSSFYAQLLCRAIALDNVYPKALANFIFRSVIEDAHSKYKIPDEEIKRMCKEAVNRAALFWQIIEDERLLKTFAIEAYTCGEWDEPELTEDLKKRLEVYRSLAEELEL